MKQSRLIDDFVKTLVSGIKGDPRALWPIHPFTVEPLFCDEFTKKIIEIRNRCQDKGYEQAYVASLFRNPGRIWNSMPVVVQGLKAMETPIPERIDLIEYYLTLVRNLMFGDIFCREGVIILSPKDVESLIKETTFLKQKDPTESLKMRRLAGVLWAFCEAVYYLRRKSGESIHGPYDVSTYFEKNTNLMVRDYFFLKPMEIWPELKDLSIEKVKILAVYKNVQWTFNIFGSFASNLPLGENLLAYSLILESTDGTISVNPSQESVEKVVKELANFTEHVSRETNTSGKVFQATKQIDLCFYMLKPACDHLNMDWRPPKKVYRRLEKLGLIPLPKPPKDSEEAFRGLLSTFDPRTEIFPWKPFLGKIKSTH